MIVKKIEWLSEEAQEAILVAGDEYFECVPFCHPCLLKVGEIIQEPLYAMDACNVMLQEDDADIFIEYTGLGFDHVILGEVLSLEERIICVGTIRIQLGSPLPGGISEGDKVQFYCSRLDVFD
jgi:hypothetical protein